MTWASADDWNAAFHAVQRVQARLPLAERLHNGNQRRMANDVAEAVARYRRAADEPAGTGVPARLKQLERAAEAKQVKEWRTNRLKDALGALDPDTRRIMAVVAEAHGVLPWPAEDQGHAEHDVSVVLQQRLHNAEDRLTVYAEVTTVAAETRALRGQERARDVALSQLIRSLLQIWHQYTCRGTGIVTFEDSVFSGTDVDSRYGSSFVQFVLDVCEGAGLQISRSSIFTQIQELSRRGSANDSATSRP